MIVNKTRLIQIFTDLRKKGITDGMMRTLIESLWRVYHRPETITADTENVLGPDWHTHKLELPQTQITEIIKTVIGNNHESYLIEDTENASETVESTWTVLPYNEQVGEFKAVVMVRNKSLDTIITLMNILSFDYTDTVKVVQQNPMLTDVNITLTTGVNAQNKLYATVSGMTADHKRIHLCFERCVLSQRYNNMAANISFTIQVAAHLSGLMNMSSSASLQFGMTAGLSHYRQLKATGTIEFGLIASASYLRQLKATADMQLNLGAAMTYYRRLQAQQTFNLGLAALLTLEATPVDFALLYNLDAVNDARELAPFGWRVASLADWNDLITHYGGEAVAGGDMKATTVWQAPNTGATNTDEFTALPAGQRDDSGEFSGKLTKGIFWIK